MSCCGNKPTSVRDNRVLIRFFGNQTDALQFTAVLEQIKLTHSYWIIDIQSSHSTIFSPLCNNVSKEINDIYPQVYEINWETINQKDYTDSCSTKVTCCLRETFNIIPENIKYPIETPYILKLPPKNKGYVYIGINDDIAEFVESLGYCPINYESDDLHKLLKVLNECTLVISYGDLYNSSTSLMVWNDKHPIYHSNKKSTHLITENIIKNHAYFENNYEYYIYSTEELKKQIKLILDKNVLVSVEKDFVVGIPTLNQYDRLDNCIDKIFSGSVIPTKVYVIDNGGTYTNPKATIIKTESNLGVAVSWNVLMRISHPKPVIIMNDDLFVEYDTFGRMLSVKNEAIITVKGFSCFMLDRKVYDLLGNFDEKFYPAYFEDDDYRYRLKLSGFHEYKLENVNVEHHKSSTVKSFNEEQNVIFKEHWDKSHLYYSAKWGGIPHEEKFKYPFNRNTSDNALLELYEKSYLLPSDISDHCPTLYNYSQQSDHVTQIGGSCGSATISLLYGKPKKFIAYDPVLKTNSHLLKAIASNNTNVQFIFQEPIDIEETDLLFVDNDEHDYESVSKILKLSPKVKKWIILHDTVIFKDKSPTGKEGIWKAIEELKDFTIEKHFINNNGLTVLKKNT